jgi:hypothetical protein
LEDISPRRHVGWWADMTSRACPSKVGLETHARMKTQAWHVDTRSAKRQETSPDATLECTARTRRSGGVDPVDHPLRIRSS